VSVLVIEQEVLRFVLAYEVLFALVPHAIDLVSSCVLVYSFAVLLSVLEAPIIHATIWPGVDSVTVFFVVDVVSFVDSAVAPTELPLAMHFVVFPLPLVLGAVSPLKVAFAVLLAFQVGALIIAAIRPLLASFAVLLVLDPAAFVRGAFCVEVFTLTVSFVVCPIALVHISVSQYEPAESLGLVLLPETLVLAAIWPDLDAVAELLLSGGVDGAAVDLAFGEDLTVGELQFDLILLDFSQTCVVELQSFENLFLKFYLMDARRWHFSKVVFTELVRLLSCRQVQKQHLFKLTTRQMSPDKRVDTSDDFLDLLPLIRLLRHLHDLLVREYFVRFQYARVWVAAVPSKKARLRAFSFKLAVELNIVLV